jgi:hypothetical protein
MLGAVVVAGAGLVALGITEARAAEAHAPRPAVRMVTVFDQAPGPPPVTPTPAPTPTEAPTSAPERTAASAMVTAFIPARTFVHVDAAGDVTDAMTNSGRAPAPTDQFFVSEDGPARPLDAATATAVVASASGVDWSEAGRWHSLTAG